MKNTGLRPSLHYSNKKKIYNLKIRRVNENNMGKKQGVETGESKKVGQNEKKIKVFKKTKKKNDPECVLIEKPVAENETEKQGTETLESQKANQNKKKIKVFKKTKKKNDPECVITEKPVAENKTEKQGAEIGESSKANQNKKKIKVFTKAKKKNDPESTIIEKLVAKYEIIDSTQITKFSDFPLAAKTIKGLRDSGYHKPTDIQKETIGLALQGKDILGAAQTGSGKTLAFLIPILEILFTNQWTRLDGVGALVITPTRELAYQIFEALRRIGNYHDFSAGLIIGGKDLKFERTRMDQCNIIICTPGRLLQHMDENPLFDCVNMKVLVLDEADRCLDMGFEKTMNAIIDNLPLTRQTLLFSATQTKSVKDLARLSLKDPRYVSVHEHSEFSTPKGLSQSYAICELEDKITVLWSFLRSHPNKKIMVFFSSCKQVKYTYEIFCKLRPGSSLMALYGKLHQLRRMDIYEQFCRKKSAILFATDLVARGLDFPEVHWVIQVDCPEDPETYIHRVGRTARFHKGGESLLLLLPSEAKMVEKLKEKKIPIEKIDVNPMKLINPVRKMEAYLAKDPTLKDSAQRAFVSYIKAVFLMKDKEVFDAQSLDTNSFAKSLGLAIPPRIRFLQRMNARMEQEKSGLSANNLFTKNSQNSKKYFDDEREDSIEAVKNEPEDSDVSEDEGREAGTNPNLFEVSDEESDNDDILQVKRRDHDIELPTDKEIADLDLGRNKNKKPISKAAAAKKILKKKIIPNKKIVFNEEGDAVQTSKDKKSELAIEYENENEGGIDIEKARKVLREEDKFDKQMFKEKVKAKHREEKKKLKEKKKKREEENEVHDDFGESESDPEPDLSWLPDPDAIYGEKTEEEIERLKEEIDERNVESSSVSLKQKRGEKRKGEQKIDNLETVLKKKKHHKIKELSSSLSVNEAEELALLLLKNK